MNVKLLRGRVVIREDYDANVAQYKHIIVPSVSTKHDKDAVARDRKWHVGRVLQMGAPALTNGGKEVPHGFCEGDKVIFHWNHYEEGFTRRWVDGELACFVPQNCVDAVLEEESN